MNMKLQDRYDYIEPGDPKHEALYEKMLKKEEMSGYYTGVTTTGIACRFGCSAAPPQRITQSSQEGCLISLLLAFVNARCAGL